MDTKRRGIEQFTGAFHPVTWSQERADAGLPPWMSDLEEQFFLDSEVEEDDQLLRGEGATDA